MVLRALRRRGVRAALAATGVAAAIAAPAGEPPRAAPATSATTTDPAPLVTPCSPFVSGGLPDGWRAMSLVVGDTGLYPARAWTRYPARLVAESRASEGPGSAFLLPLDAEVGRRAATVTVDPSDRPHAALLFDRRRFRSHGRYRLVDGRAAVRFSSCGERRRTRSIGALLVDGPRCVGLTIREAGRAPVSRVMRVATGPRCLH